jgi:hypothetical protein
MDTSSAEGINVHWLYEQSSIDWIEVSRLYRIAPLGAKSPEHLQRVFANSMFGASSSTVAYWSARAAPSPMASIARICATSWSIRAIRARAWERRSS